METDIHIRPARARDWKAVEGLLRAFSLPLVGVPACLDETYAVATHTEASDGENIIGVAGVEVYGEHGLLRSVAVSPAWQGRTVGKALVDERLAWAAARGLTDLFLITIDKADYFKRFGFVSIDRHAVPDEVRASSEFASLCPETAAVMRKQLGESADGSTNQV